MGDLEDLERVGIGEGGFTGVQGWGGTRRAAVDWKWTDAQTEPRRTGTFCALVLPPVGRKK